MFYSLRNGVFVDLDAKFAFCTIEKVGSTAWAQVLFKVLERDPLLVKENDWNPMAQAWQRLRERGIAQEEGRRGPVANTPPHPSLVSSARPPTGREGGSVWRGRVFFGHGQTIVEGFAPSCPGPSAPGPRPPPTRCEQDLQRSGIHPRRLREGAACTLRLRVLRQVLHREVLRERLSETRGGCNMLCSGTGFVSRRRGAAALWSFISRSLG